MIVTVVRRQWMTFSLIVFVLSLKLKTVNGVRANFWIANEMVPLVPEILRQHLHLVTHGLIDLLTAWVATMLCSIRKWPKAIKTNVCEGWQFCQWMVQSTFAWCTARKEYRIHVICVLFLRSSKFFQKLIFFKVIKSR